MSEAKFAYFASTAVRIVDRIPTLIWAAWILAVLIGTAVLAVISTAHYA